MGSGFGIWPLEGSLGFGALGFRRYGSDYTVQALGFGLRVQASGFGFQVSGFNA